MAQGVGVDNGVLIEKIALRYFTADISDPIKFLDEILKECNINIKKISTEQLATEIVNSKNVFVFEDFLRKARIISGKRKW